MEAKLQLTSYKSFRLTFLQPLTIHHIFLGRHDHQVIDRHKKKMSQSIGSKMLVHT